jgi:hypothetical protein
MKSKKQAPPEHLTLYLSAADPLLKELEEHGPPIDHRGCCDCALCGKVSLLSCTPVSVEVWTAFGQDRGTNVCPRCADGLRSRALSDAEVDRMMRSLT